MSPDRTDLDLLPLYQSEALSTYVDRVIHGFTGKPLSLGGPALNRDDARANRQALCRTSGLSFERLIVPGQVHSDHSKTNRDQEFSATDAVILLDPGVPALIQTADCVPVLLYSPDRHVGAVIHAGWRGTAAAVAPKVSRRLSVEFGAPIETLIAVIGPAITGSHYEVSPDVVEQLQRTLPEAVAAAIHPVLTPPDRDQTRVDLKTANRLQLEALGLKTIDVFPDCTVGDNDRFWSYRKGEAGRQGVYLQLL